MSASQPRDLLPADEESRLEALDGLGILDTEREERFDAMIAELAAKLDVPIAYLGLIAEDRQWLKSRIGPIPAETSREDAFCSRTILQDEPLAVRDAAEDPRFSASRLVQDPPHLRFYAGVPISDTSGLTVGTVCVAGPTPREITPRELAILQGFAGRLQKELDCRPGALLAYAHEDEAWVARFLASHPLLDAPGALDLWSSRRLGEGEDVAWRLKDALWHARSVVLLLSPAFLRSTFVAEELFPQLYRARELQQLTTLAVILEPCDRSTIEWLADRPPWPSNDQAVSLGTDDEADSLLRDLAIELVGPVPETDERRPQAQVFLSHAGEDAAAVKDLSQRLRQAGVNVWLDVEELQPGDDWMQALEGALDASDAFAVYIGRSGIGRWIGREVRVALDRNAKDPRFRFIPILGPGADPEALPRFVAQHHWLDLRERDPEPAEIRKLVASILSRPAEAVSLLPAGEPPFRGLLTFGAEHAHLFFGRDRETAELVERLTTSPFLAVIGDSGSGKSSLVCAGLVPALHRGHFRDAAAESPAWHIAVLRPGRDPFRALASGLLDLVPEMSPSERIATLEACSGQLATGTRGLCDAISALVPKGARTLLVIDQFEEVFTQAHDPDERDRFIDTLLEACSCSGDRPLHTIVTLRADFYSHCFEHPTLPRVLSTHQYAVRAIAGDTLAEVIEKPAMLAGIGLEPGLVEAILFDLGEGPGNLPLLEHTLLELWKQRTGGSLTHDSYERIGRVRGALEHHAEEVYGGFDAEEKAIARKLLLGLVVPTENAGPARRRATIAEILPASESREAAEKVLERLVEERLLVVRGSGLGENAPAGEDAERALDENEVEVTHEALLRGWRRLGGWLEEDREFLYWRQRIGSAFEAWTQSEGDVGALLRGAPLVEAQRWLESRGEDLSEDGRAFIGASVALARRQRRVRAAAVAAIAVIGAVALVLAGIANNARREAEESLLVATEAVDEMLTRVGTDALKDVPQLEGVRQELLARAGELYQQLGEQGHGAPELRLQSALGPARLARIERQTGDVKAARTGLESAIGRLEALTGREPQRPEYRLELARTLNDLGWLLTDSPGEAGSLEEASEHLDRAIAMGAALLDAGPDRADYAYELARGHLNRGNLRRRSQQAELAEADYEAAIGYAEPFEKRPGVWRQKVRQQLARTHNQLAILKLEDTEAAVAHYRDAIGLFESLRTEHPGSREYQKELATAYYNLALNSSEPQETDEYSRKAVELFADLADALPDIRSGWANAHTLRGQVLEATEREQALASYEEARRIFAKLLADYPPHEHPARKADLYSEAVTLVYLALLRSDAGEAREVERIRPRFVEILRDLGPQERAEVEPWFPRKEGS